MSPRIETAGPPEPQKPKQSLPSRLLSGFIALFTLKGVRAHFASKKAKQEAIDKFLGDNKTRALLYRGILESLTSDEVQTLVKIEGITPFLGLLNTTKLKARDIRPFLKKVAASPRWQNAIATLPKILELEPLLGTPLSAAATWNIIRQLADESIGDKECGQHLTKILKSGGKPFATYEDAIATLEKYPVTFFTSLRYRLEDVYSTEEVKDLQMKLLTELTPTTKEAIKTILASVPFLQLVVNWDQKNRILRFEEFEQNEVWQAVIANLSLFHDLKAVLKGDLRDQEIWEIMEALGTVDQQRVNTPECLEKLKRFLETCDERTTLSAEAETLRQELAAVPLQPLQEMLHCFDPIRREQWNRIIPYSPLFYRLKNVLRGDLAKDEIWALMNGFVSANPAEVNISESLRTFEKFIEECEKQPTLTQEAIGFKQQLSALPIEPLKKLMEERF